MVIIWDLEWLTILIPIVCKYQIWFVEVFVGKKMIHKWSQNIFIHMSLEDEIDIWTLFIASWQFYLHIHYFLFTIHTGNWASHFWNDVEHVQNKNMTLTPCIHTSNLLYSIAFSIQDSDIPFIGANNTIQCTLNPVRSKLSITSLCDHWVQILNNEIIMIIKNIILLCTRLQHMHKLDNAPQQNSHRYQLYSSDNGVNW